MFNRPVVFVIGAGASADYGMPLGGTLATKIASDTDFWFDHGSYRPTRGDADRFDILLRKYQNDRTALNRFTEAGRSLSGAILSSVSIDDALYHLSDYPEAVILGKISIIRSILKAEGLSALKIKPETGAPDTDAGRSGWAEQMFSMAISQLKLAQIGSAFDNITFINFNYDRCLEHYLFWSLHRLGIREIDASQIIGKLSIIRPYGTIGSILPNDRSRVPFGASQVDPFAIVDRIRTYTESEVLHDKEHLQELLRRAHMCIFLGFGFHRQNVELLTLDSQEGFRAVRTLATVKGIHKANRREMTAFTYPL